MEKEILQSIWLQREECPRLGKEWAWRGPLESPVVQRRDHSRLAKVVSVDGFESNLAASQQDLEVGQMCPDV